jgi:hypothetical protein
MSVKINGEEITNPFMKVLVAVLLFLFIGIVFSIIGAVFTSPVWVTYLILT